MKQDYTQSQSAFNMGIAYLKRIDNILYMCWMNSQSCNIHGWLSQLRALYRELAIKMTKGKGDKKDGEMDDFKAKFNDINVMVNKGVNPGNTNEILSKLDELEVDLRILAQKKGMLLPSKDDPRFAITQR